MKTSLLTAALGLAVLAAGPARADDKPAGDLAKLQGKWTTKYSADSKTTLTLVIAGKSVEATFISDQGGGGMAMKGEVTVNEAAKPHKTIDFTNFKRLGGENLPPDLGIYVIEDDNTVKVCAGGPGKDRPTEFKIEEKGPRVVVLKRQGEAQPAATAETKSDLKGDLAKFQGKWTGKAGPEKNYAVTVVFTGKTCTAKVTTPDGQEFEVKGELALNEAAKPHKTIDWKNFKGPNGDDFQDNPGLYTFKDDNTLEICNGGPGKERPTEFKVGDGEDPQLFTLKREPAAKKAATPSPAAKGDLAKFQGNWTAKAGPEKNVDVNVTFKGDAVSVAFTTPEGQERSMKGVVAIDEAAKPHKTISFKGFTRQDGSDAPESLGIYALEGDDTLRICNGGPGRERPTEFKAGDNGAPPQLIELKRKK
jgi:uncharacterized protein (TIGR03067 family)